MPTLRVQLLGGLALAWGDRPLSPISGATARSLFAYLVMHRDRPHSRDLLAGTFWPDLPDATARHRLSRALWEIRCAFQPHTVLLAKSDTIQVDPDLTPWVDVEEFEQQMANSEPGADTLKARTLQQAIDLYQGELPAGFYDEWALVERERLRDLFLAASTPATAQSGGDYDLEWQVIGSAGDQFPAGGDYQIGFTLAQAQDTPISAGGGYQIAQGYWVGGASTPTAVVVAGFWIEARADALVACWETATELDTLGFNLYRSESGEPGTYVRLNEGLIPGQAPGSPLGAYYEWTDPIVVPGQTYFYLLEAVDVYGQATQYGPAAGSLPAAGEYHVYLPLVYGNR